MEQLWRHFGETKTPISLKRQFMANRIGGGFHWIKNWIVIGGIALTPAGVNAIEEPHGYDQVALSTVTEGTAPREVIIATLMARHEGPSLESLTGETNREVKNALEKAKKTVGVKVQTQNYQTIPTYQDQKPSGWLVQQSIRIESRDSEKLSALLGDLQKTLKLDSITYEIAPETRKSVEDHLILEALKAFEDRAKQITESLGRKRYRVVKLDIGTGPSQFQNPRTLARVQMAEPSSRPVFETGEAPFTITVQGTIELQPN